MLNDDEAEAEAEPEWRAPDPVAEQGELADFPSVLDSQTVMHAWTAVSTTGDEPVPRCGHCAWTKGAREMWVTHGNVNGRKLAGGPKVLDLATCRGRRGARDPRSTTTRRPREP